MTITTLLLATLWLPATVHCQLERLGLDAFFACADATTTETGHSEDASCADDGCQTIEAGQVAVSKARIDAASLALLACTCHFCLFEIPAPQPAPEFTATAQDTTLPLQRTWQFDRRAAAPPRAPGLNA
jgi:hypothetical protein